jgi:hypothetical protein
LTQFMETLRTEASAEADEIFTADKLRVQRQLIARKLEHLGHPARVIHFPGRQAGHRIGVAAPRPTRRWVAAAAAAGLFVGIGTGLWLDWERAPDGRSGGVIARQTLLTSPASHRAVEIARPDPSEDNRFLTEIELAGDRPHIRELLAVDELTPHVREVTLR